MFFRIEINIKSLYIHRLNLALYLSFLGKVVTAYRVRDGKSKMIGKGNPIWPQAFYEREVKSIDLKYGDKLFARCNYVSNRSIDTFSGFYLINF